MTLDLEETFVFDAVTHAYNVDPSRFRNERHATVIAEMLYGDEFDQQCAEGLAAPYSTTEVAGDP